MSPPPRPRSRRTTTSAACRRGSASSSSIRCLGEVTAERLDILRNADWVVVDEIKRNGLYRQVWQSFAVLTPLETVGVMGDYRTYANVVAVRVVTSEDAMTADWARVPYEVLARISNRIVNRSEERRVGQ